MSRFRSALSLFLLAGAAGGGEPQGVRVDPQAPRGAIGGRIVHPGGVAPAMRICALWDGGQRCVDSPSGRSLYRIEGLHDGGYQVVARVDDVATPVAGHVQPVQCVRAPCQAQLGTVEIAGGQEVGDADLNGFYAARPDFPALTQ